MPVHPKMTNEERYERGLQTLQKMAGEEDVRMIEGMGEFHPDFGHMMIAFGFGDIYSRSAFDLKQREVITLTSLITQGATEQLPFHLHAALNVGMSPEEILELVMHCAAYAGFPKACGALTVVKRVFDERNIVPNTK
ncbi:carboxymuconolactone decarboxylase family protein [Aneurinibacillus migulanus]|uniref:4-carboxymuconolactone decarboxylase n=2 Tax=Aneurinibacillus migulanus TaxID=47500 RepID=A0A1G8Z0T6_ANEMI|nr:carboxymuconolactone decarboxylase family protein [Aneurinibacillus migulanus]MED0890762.1 carboxymuconolactone decarboxylase family protein [Aneurinibacillus migulanus]MED1618285.1 carboxymuconolactone decarboxylase family protein [Aneurinibacillus migulanus]GED16131.1 4-carboxymuconolactone decarboxylase [Aneurinibacillus migulanus]SDK08587.1 4-carboxymuconolactone decarboxylase [Aneurinibacillus migulanus]